MTRRSFDTETHYCHDLTCPGAKGFEVRWNPATMIDPAWPETDACPFCGLEMHNEPLNTSDPLDAFLAALDDAGVRLPGDTDEDELLRVIAVELGRQLKAEREAEYQSRRATAKINREFPTDQPPTWLAEGTNR
jgi:hypothetical protein